MEDYQGDFLETCQKSESPSSTCAGPIERQNSRLGYPVWDDGTFEPEEMEDHVAGMSVDDLIRQIEMPK